MPSVPSPEALESLLFLAETGGDVPEVDLHGLRWDEARASAETLVQRVFLDGDRVLRVVHGKGEGRLRDALHRWLSEHPLIAGFREAGSGGSTLVVLHPR